MSSSIDVRAVARRAFEWEARYVPHLGPLNEPMAVSDYDALAMARVVEAAAERVKTGHSIDCDKYIWTDDEGDPVPLPAERVCTCGHDLLAAALDVRGKGEES